MDKNIRQTNEFKDFFAFIGWECITTDSGIKIYLHKLLNRTLVKIPRPHVFSKKELEEIEAICLKKKALLAKIEPELGQDITLLTDVGFKKNYYPLSPPSSMILDLTKSELDLWASISHSGKYSINRSKREGDYVEFVKGPSKEDVKQLYDAMEWTGKNKHYYVEPFAHIYKRVSLFGDNAHIIKVFNKNKDYVGGAVYLCHASTATFMYGAINSLGRQGKAGYQLLWQATLYLKSLGYKWFDLEGVDDPRFPMHTKTWGGFSHFKEKFKGTVVVYPEPYMKVYSRMFKLLAKFQPLPF